MQMDIVGTNLKLTAAIERHVAGRIQIAIGRASRSIDGAMARLRDVNGTRGGVDMACRIVVWLRKGGTVVVEAVDRDLYAAVDAAGFKMKEAVRRQLKRRRTLQREHASRRPRANA
jgi:ribosome-associated translation inhibitor RaiA